MQLIENVDDLPFVRTTTTNKASLGGSTIVVRFVRNDSKTFLILGGANDRASVTAACYKTSLSGLGQFRMDDLRRGRL